jgi:sporulation protein YlmC with PRC-barrel domain
MARLPIRSILCATAILGGILAPVLGSTLGLWSLAGAQQAPPAAAPPTPRNEPPSSKPPAVKPSEAPAAAGEKDLVGLDVFSSDGTRVGDVRAVSTGPSGDIVALLVRTGGFLGFGSRIVAIPHGRFSRAGRSVRLDLDSGQVSELPEVKE